MKFYQKILLAGLFVGVLGWAASATAAPIPYTFTWYTAHAETDGGISEQTYPYFFPLLVDSTDYYSFFGPTVAHAEAPDSSHFYASSYSVSDSPSSFLQATFQFTSTFPAIRIQYDFNLSAYAVLNTFGLPEFSTASGEGAINSFLMDTTTGLTIWRDDQIVTVSVFGPGPPFDENGGNSGSTDEILALTLGHEYELFLSCSSKALGSSGIIWETTGYGSAELNNIRVDAVPIPSTLLLLSTGLVGLLGFRRRLKG